ncbi:hypothetical protein BEWA_017040 [Theileria equi strain WA]|uniref:Uncharacterized protein n=1 Tax=Theileria equi strain WA TaxID=1537102 RepID=L1L9Z9_THEEQ|nr:hypothetical protein BEWA_017040 [Theileria equi strain WA]EKX72025.1 hypothetical protein BEWA_017040 [Theileria equi strain WA]|eukprot:XP_004831477.1 hypothetical protein BEWA_017040 [Theileria equi strain WA]
MESVNFVRDVQSSYVAFARGLDVAIVSDFSKENEIGKGDWKKCANLVKNSGSGENENDHVVSVSALKLEKQTVDYVVVLGLKSGLIVLAIIDSSGKLEVLGTHTLDGLAELEVHVAGKEFSAKNVHVFCKVNEEVVKFSWETKEVTKVTR